MFFTRSKTIGLQLLLAIVSLSQASEINTLTDSNSAPLVQLHEYLFDRSIALVGPAKSAYGEYFGKRIDSADIVARVNTGVYFDPDYSQHYGQRIDILFAEGGAVHRGLMRSNKQHWQSSKWVVCLTPHNDPGKVDGLRYLIQSLPSPRPQLYLAPKHWLDLFQQALPEANTGIIAIEFLKQARMRKLEIYGFDFYETGYNDKLIEMYIHHFRQKPETRSTQFDRPTVTVGKEMARTGGRPGIPKNIDQIAQRNYFDRYLRPDHRIFWIRPHKEIFWHSAWLFLSLLSFSACQWLFSIPPGKVPFEPPKTFVSYLSSVVILAIVAPWFETKNFSSKKLLTLLMTLWAVCGVLANLLLWILSTHHRTSQLVQARQLLPVFSMMFGFYVFHEHPTLLSGILITLLPVILYRFYSPLFRNEVYRILRPENWFILSLVVGYCASLALGLVLIRRATLLWQPWSVSMTSMVTLAAGTGLSLRIRRIPLEWSRLLSGITWLTGFLLAVGQLCLFQLAITMKSSEVAGLVVLSFAGAAIFASPKPLRVVGFCLVVLVFAVIVLVYGR